MVAVPSATSGSPMLFARLLTPAKGRFGEKKISRIAASFRAPVSTILVSGVYCIHIDFRSSLCCRK